MMPKIDACIKKMENKHSALLIDNQLNNKANNDSVNTKCIVESRM